MLPIRVSLDRLVLVYKNVTLEEYDKFITRIQANNIYYPNTPIKNGISSSMSSYRYNMNFGFGQGGIRLDYRHNTLNQDVKQCDLRIEFNPNKLHFLDHEYKSKDKSGNPVTKQSEPSKLFFYNLNDVFNKAGKMNPVTNEWSGHVRAIRELDIAYDFNLPTEKIIIMNNTGKEHSYYKGTHYWGNKHTHAYFKKYDKKKEREKFKDRMYDKYQHVTRLEYTIRMEKDQGINTLDRIKEWDMSNYYKVVLYDEKIVNKFDPTIKAHLLCYLHDLMDFKEFTRRYKEKTKRALDDLTEINLSAITSKDFKTKILQNIKQYIRN